MGIPTLWEEVMSEYEGEPHIDEDCDGKLVVKNVYPWIVVVCDTCGLEVACIDGNPRNEAAIRY